MTSSFKMWECLRGSDWPDYPLVDDINTIDLPRFLINELEIRGYKHNYSFIDSYANGKNFECIQLSQGGTSNFFIKLQIQQAIDNCADYVIIGATAPERFEIPFDSQDTEHIQNFNSKKYIISTQFNDKINLLSTEIISAVKHYKTYIQDLDIESIKSYCMLQDGLRQLEKKNIPYVFIPGPLKNQDWTQNHIVWPNDKYQPWDRQHGEDIRGNHNNKLSHAEYLQTLFDITQEWV